MLLLLRVYSLLRDTQTHRQQGDLIHLLRIVENMGSRLKSDWETLVPRINVESVLNWDFYWNKCTLYIEIKTLLKHYYMYSILFIEITQSF
jgi:hypothetical protein